MIRKALECDIDKIIDLLHQVCLVHHDVRPDYFKDSIKYKKEELKEKIKDDLNPIFVYVKNNIVLGYLFCIDETIKDHQLLTDRKTLYIDDLCVDKDTRGMGIGKKLYEYVKAYAKEKGYYNVTLNVWADNKNAMAFYEALGLKPLKCYMEEILN